MKTSPVTIADLQRSVLSVPPLCRNNDLSLNQAENKKQIAHLEAGGISTLIYGGNANFYNIGTHEYAETLDMLINSAADDSWIIPSVGPDYGKMMDQAEVLKDFDFPTVMVLPLVFPMSPTGAEEGIRRFADSFGKPVISYVKFDGYLEPKQVAGLMDDGVVCAVKYARVLEDSSIDPYLEELIKLVGTERIISGIGERPAITHWTKFGLRSFTSGSACVAPSASDQILRALQENNIEEAENIRKIFMPLEDMRDELSPLCVLHRAVDLAGIANTGPLTPMLSDVVEGASWEKLANVSKELLALGGSRKKAA